MIIYHTEKTEKSQPISVQGLWDVLQHSPLPLSRWERGKSCQRISHCQPSSAGEQAGDLRGELGRPAQHLRWVAGGGHLPIFQEDNPVSGQRGQLDIMGDK
jgi:hypothetical protein